MLLLLGHHLISLLPCRKTSPESRSSLDSFPVCELEMLLESGRQAAEIAEPRAITSQGGVASSCQATMQEANIASFSAFLKVSSMGSWVFCAQVCSEHIKGSQPLRSFQSQTTSTMGHKGVQVVTRDPVLYAWLLGCVFAHPTLCAQLLGQTGRNFISFTHLQLGSH